MGADRSLLKRMTLAFCHVMAASAMGLVACDQSVLEPGPLVAQQKQQLGAGEGRKPSISIRPASSPAIQKSVQDTSSNAPKVMYRGCRVVQKTPTGSLCLPSAGSRTVLWVEGIACDKLEVREDKQPLAFDTSYVNGGCQLRQKEPSKQPHSVLSLRNKVTGTDFWQLPMDRSKPWLMEWTDRMWRRDSVDLEGTEAELQSQSLEQAAPEVRVDLLMARAVVLFRLGQIHNAIRMSSQVVEIARQYGFDSIAFDAARLRWNAFLHAGLLEDAWSDIQAMRSLAQDDKSASQVAWELDAGQLSMEMGRFQEADDFLSQCMLDAGRLDFSYYLRHARPWHARVLFALDRFSDAWEAQKIAASYLDKLDDCAKADLLSNLGENLLRFMQDEAQSRQQDGCDVHQSRIYFEKALELRQKCTNDLSRIHIGLAQISFAENRFQDAQAHLEKIDNFSDSIYIDKLDELELRGKITLANGRPVEAYKHFERMGQLLSSIHRSRFACKAVMGLMESSMAQGMNDPALAQDVRECLQKEELSPFDHRMLRARASSLRLLPR